MPCVNASSADNLFDSRLVIRPSTRLPEGIGEKSVCQPESDLPCLFMIITLFAVNW